MHLPLIWETLGSSPSAMKKHYTMFKSNFYLKNKICLKYLQPAFGGEGFGSSRKISPLSWTANLPLIGLLQEQSSKPMHSEDSAAVFRKPCLGTTKEDLGFISKLFMWKKSSLYIRVVSIPVLPRVRACETANFLSLPVVHWIEKSRWLKKYTLT